MYVTSNVAGMPGVAIPHVTPPFDVMATASNIAIDASYPCVMPARVPRVYVTTNKMKIVIAFFTVTASKTRRPAWK